MKKIPLKNSDQYALVDDRDYGHLSRWTWYRRGGYAYRKGVKIKGKQKNILMHRQVLGLHETDKTLVDHIDSNGLNNSWHNLRLASYAQNSYNQRIRITPGKASKYKGVSRWRNKWRSRIVMNREEKHLGVFVTENEAALAYNRAANELYGDRAFLNSVV